MSLIFFLMILYTVNYKNKSKSKKIKNWAKNKISLFHNNTENFWKRCCFFLFVLMNQKWTLYLVTTLSADQYICSFFQIFPLFLLKKTYSSWTPKDIEYNAPPYATFTKPPAWWIAWMPSDTIEVLHSIPLSPPV